MVSKGNYPQMAARFRLVKYYNLPRYIVVLMVHRGSYSLWYQCMLMYFIDMYWSIETYWNRSC